MDNIKNKWMLEQITLKKLLKTEDENWKSEKKSLKYVGGVDISFKKNSNLSCAGLVILDYPSLKLVYEDYIIDDIDVPYISGFLAFREVKYYQILINRLKKKEIKYMPDVILVDGNGILHQREFGSASHFGVIANIPTIGIGKNLLLVDELDEKMVNDQITKSNSNQYAKIKTEKGKELGAAVFTGANAKNPIYVSIGHRISLDTAISVVLTVSNYRTPEPIRQADIGSKKYLLKHFDT